MSNYFDCLFGTIAAVFSPSCQQHQEQTEPSRRRTRATNSTDAFESLPLRKGDVWRCAIFIHVYFALINVAFSYHLLRSDALC